LKQIVIAKDNSDLKSRQALGVTDDKFPTDGIGMADDECQ